MSCEAFDRWLDDGASATDDARFRAHAAGCARCAAALDAERAIAGMLTEPVAASAMFTDRVMERVAWSERAAASRRAAPASRFALPWWAQAAAQPATVLAFAVAALTVWGADRMISGGFALVQSTAEGALSLIPRTMPGALGDPALVLGFGLALLPLVVWVSLRLFRWSEHAATAFAPRSRRLPA